MTHKKSDTIQHVNLYFGKKDPDLCKWVHSVPRGLFSYLVRECIKAHLNGDENYKLLTFESDKEKTSAILKTVSISMDTPEDKQIYDFISSLDDNMRSFVIKQILRKYLKNSNDGILDSNNISNKTFPIKSNKKEIIEENIPNAHKKQNDKIAKLINLTRNRSR